MPWKVEARNDEWCVVKEDDGSVEGCHASRGQAVAQQSALYAAESRTASADNGKQEQVRIQVGPERDETSHALVASLNSFAERMDNGERALVEIVEALGRIVDSQSADREVFLQALTAAAVHPEQEPPVVNVYVPEIVVPVPTVNVHVPKTKLLVPAPVVNVQLPGAKRKVTLERDPLTGQISQAEIEEQ